MTTVDCERCTMCNADISNTVRIVLGPDIRTCAKCAEGFEEWFQRVFGRKLQKVNNDGSFTCHPL